MKIIINCKISNKLWNSCCWF